MATVTHRNFTTSTANAATYASSSFTPGATELLIVMCVCSDTTTATPTMTDSAGLGFTFVGSRVAFGSSAHSAYWFIADSLTGGSPAAMTVTLSVSGDNATGCIHYVAGVSGMSRTGASALLQFAKSENQAAAGTPAATFGASVLTGNPTLGLVGNSTNPAGLTPPTSWTESANGDKGYNTPPTGSEYVFRDSGFTGTTITWGSTSASAFGASIVELDTSAGGTTLTIDDPGELTFTGQTINLRETELEPITPGTLTFAGQTITTSVAVTAQITTPGTLSFSGQVIPAVTSTPVTAGTLAFTGQTITTSVAVTLVVTPGALTFAGQDITTRETVRAAVTPGTLSFQGQTVNAGVIVTNTVTPGALAFAGQQVAIRLLEAITPGALTFAGQAITTTVTGGVGPLIMTHAGPEVGGAAAGAVLIVTHEGDEAGGAASGAVHVHTRSGP